MRGSMAFLVFEKCFSPLRCCSDSPGQSGRHHPAAAHAGDPLQLPLTMTYSLRDRLFPLPTQGFISNPLAFNYVYLYLWLLLNPSLGRCSAPPKAFWYFLSHGRQPERRWLPGGSILRYDVSFALRTPGHREPCQMVKGF